MFRITAAIAALLLAVPPLHACTFCDGNLRTRQTLRMQFAQSRAVLHGQLKNPRFDKDDNGFTDLHITTVIKDDPSRGTELVLVLKSYLPVVARTPPDYLVFCAVTNGKLDPTFGIPATPAVIEYLTAAAKLDDRDAPARLTFFFKHLDSTDPGIAADAFFEFARASDKEIIKSAKQFNPARVRSLISDPKTPVERLGVFAFLLGITGGAADATFLAHALNESPLSERTSSAFGGLLAGYILLAPKDGWSFAATVLADSKRPYSVRLSTINTVRFLQSTRGAECKSEILRCCAALLPHGDLADQAIEDLRRWGYWDHTEAILALFPRPSHAAPIVQRGIVRYALSCPHEEAKRFIAAVRQTDPKLVRDVEDILELFKPVTLPKKSP